MELNYKTPRPAGQDGGLVPSGKVVCGCGRIVDCLFTLEGQEGGMCAECVRSARTGNGQPPVAAMPHCARKRRKGTG